jgi:hypothetical protein
MSLRPARLRAIVAPFTALVVAISFGAIAPPPARAQTPGSIVYILDGNVWLASPDGSTNRQITTDGTMDDPYRDPTQSDTGSIFALRHHASLHQLGRDGRQLAPPVTLASLDNGTEGLAASPDGSRVAFITTGTGTEVDPRWGTPTGMFLYGGTDVADLSGAPVDGGLGPNLLYPDWATGDRLVAADGSEIFTYAIGDDEATVWVSFTDGCVTELDCPEGQEAYASLTEPAVSPDGRLLLYTYDPFFGDKGRRIATMSGPPPAPVTTACLIPGQERHSIPPSFSPDGTALAFDDVVFDPDTFETTVGEGIRVMRVDLEAPDCGLSSATLVLPGGSQPDWGPAPIGG